MIDRFGGVMMVGNILVLIALSFSILAFFSCNTSASIEGGSLALISICATLIVGIHILDVIKVKQLEDKFEELSKTKRELEELKVNANIALNITWGLIFCDTNQLKSFSYFIKAYQYALRENDARRVDTCMQCLQLCIKKVRNKEIKKQQQFKRQVEEIIINGDNKFDEHVLGKIEILLNQINNNQS